MLHTRKISVATVPLLVLTLALCLFCLSACGDKEPEERQAFIAFLNEEVLSRKGVSLPELTAAKKKSIGGYAKHYTLLTDFQKNMAGEAGKNAREMLSLTNVENLAALAKAESSLKKASREAEKLRKSVISFREKADKAKARLPMPDDLVQAYDTVYAKVVSLPAAASAETFTSVHAVFAAILDLLDFINTNSRDMEIDGKNILLKNIGLKDELAAKMAAVREKAEILHKAYTEMTQTMLQ